MKKILNSTLAINKSETKTHRSIKFVVDKEAKVLKLGFNYFPKIVKEAETR